MAVLLMIAGGWEGWGKWGSVEKVEGRVLQPNRRSVQG